MVGKYLNLVFCNKDAIRCYVSIRAGNLVCAAKTPEFITLGLYLKRGASCSIHRHYIMQLHA